jgi:hypothetical protein
LTLPPDLSSIPGLGNDAVLRLPKFDDGARVSPPLDQRQQTYVASDPQQPAPASRRSLRGLRADDSKRQPQEPAAPYAPPPSGAQYTAPAPHGVTYTPPPPGTALPASALGQPPTTPRASDPGSFGSPTVTPRNIADGVGRPQFTAVSPELAAAAQSQPSPRIAVAPQGIKGTTATGTAGEWLIAVLPVIHFAVVYVVFGVLAEPVLPGIQWGILLAPAVLSLIFASLDRRKLLDNRHARVPSLVFAVIPPLYLLVRCFTIGGRSVAALVVWIVLQAAAVAGVFVLLDPVLKAVIAGG